MASSTHRFYHKGLTEQIHPDVVIDLKRPDKDTLAEWSEEQKLQLLKWLEDCDRVYSNFKRDLILAL